MKNAKLRTMSVKDLVDLFTGLALQQDEAELAFDDVKVINRLYRMLKEIEGELKSRPGDQRHALLPLFNHPNPQVRLKAAKATLAIAPVAARQVLESIAETCYGPQKGEAGMSLWNLDRGVYKPT